MFLLSPYFYPAVLKLPIVDSVFLPWYLWFYPAGNDDGVYNCNDELLTGNTHVGWKHVIEMALFRVWTIQHLRPAAAGENFMFTQQQESCRLSPSACLLFAFALCPPSAYLLLVVFVLDIIIIQKRRKRSSSSTTEGLILSFLILSESSYKQSGIESLLGNVKFWFK